MGLWVKSHLDEDPKNAWLYLEEHPT